MAVTESTMRLQSGAAAPDFRLADVVTGETVSLDAGKNALVVMFICRYCPCVVHVSDAPSSLKQMARELGFNFPFCL